MSIPGADSKRLLKYRRLSEGYADLRVSMREL
jgi:hypothetical protein